MEEFIVYLKDYCNRLQTVLEEDIETVYVNGKEHLYKMRSESKSRITNELETLTNIIKSYEQFKTNSQRPNASTASTERTIARATDSAKPTADYQW